MRHLCFIAVCLLAGCQHRKQHTAQQFDGTWKCTSVEVDAKTGEVTKWHCKDDAHDKRYEVKPL